MVTCDLGREPHAASRALSCSVPQLGTSITCGERQGVRTEGLKQYKPLTQIPCSPETTREEEPSATPPPPAVTSTARAPRLPAPSVDLATLSEAASP